GAAIRQTLQLLDYSPHARTPGAKAARFAPVRFRSENAARIQQKGLMPRTMHAGVFLGNRTIEPRQLPIPEPGEGQVLLRVVGCGVCGTDYHIYAGEFTRGV